MSSRRRLLLPLRTGLLSSSASLHSVPCLQILNARSYRVSASEGGAKNRRGASPHGGKSLSQLVLALRTFHQLERHFAVPFSFVVPRNSLWPKEVHELPLGMKVHKFMQALDKRSASMERSKQGIEQLQSMGFPLHSWQDYLFQEIILPGLRTYVEQYGDLFVPQKFVVPEEETDEAKLWPRATRGYKLGLAVAKMRKQVQQQKQREQQLKDQQFKDKKKQGEKATAILPPLPKNQVDALNSLGFVWRVRDTKWYQFFLPGLRRYKEIYGNADVPLAFTIPVDDEKWPKVLEGYMLGRHVHMVRTGKYATQARDSRDQLNELGFSFRLMETVWENSIFPALEVFATQYGHCDVYQDFVVPSEVPWPSDSWGLKLGDTVKNIRRGAYNSQVKAARQELNNLGFVWNARHRVEKTVRSVVIPALTTYRRLHGTDALVTLDFVVPDRDPNWPVLTRGFKLGQWITRARSGQVSLSPKLRAELDNVGFVWNSNDQRWNDVLLPAFRTFAELHDGTCASMSTKFIVPPEAPYPRSTWGVNLGGALWHIRNGDSYVNSEDKRRELRVLGILAHDAVA